MKNYDPRWPPIVKPPVLGEKVYVTDQFGQCRVLGTITEIEPIEELRKNLDDQARPLATPVWLPPGFVVVVYVNENFSVQMRFREEDRVA